MFIPIIFQLFVNEFDWEFGKQVDQNQKDFIDVLNSSMNTSLDEDLLHFKEDEEKPVVHDPFKVKVQRLLELKSLANEIDVDMDIFDGSGGIRAQFTDQGYYEGIKIINRLGPFDYLREVNDDDKNFKIHYDTSTVEYSKMDNEDFMSHVNYYKMGGTNFPDTFFITNSRKSIFADEGRRIFVLDETTDEVDVNFIKRIITIGSLLFLGAVSVREFKKLLVNSNSDERIYFECTWKKGGTVLIRLFNRVITVRFNRLFKFGNPFKHRVVFKMEKFTAGDSYMMSLLPFRSVTAGGNSKKKK